MAGLAPPAWLGGSTYGKGNSRPDGGWHPSRVLHHRRRKAWQAGEPQLLRFDSRAEVPSINPRRAASTVPSIARAGQVWSSGSLRCRCVLLPPPSLLLPDLARAPPRLPQATRRPLARHCTQAFLLDCWSLDPRRSSHPPSSGQPPSRPGLANALHGMQAILCPGPIKTGHRSADPTSGAAQRETRPAKAKTAKAHSRQHHQHQLQLQLSATASSKADGQARRRHVEAGTAVRGRLAARGRPSRHLQRPGCRAWPVCH